MVLPLLKHSAASGQYDHCVNREVNPKYDWFHRPEKKRFVIQREITIGSL